MAAERRDGRFATVGTPDILTHQAALFAATGAAVDRVAQRAARS